MTSRWARVARGWLTASVSVFVAAFSHVLSGGQAPGVLGAVLALVFATIASVFLAGARPSWPRLVVSVAVSQFLLHFLFSLGGTAAGISSTGGHHEAIAFSSNAAQGAVHGGHDGPAMWLGHAVAAIVTIALLRYAESVMLAVSAMARPWLLAAAFLDVSPVAIVSPRRAPFRPSSDETPITERFLGAVSRRGPPSLAFA